MAVTRTLHVDDDILIACPSLEHAEAIVGNQGLCKSKDTQLVWQKEKIKELEENLASRDQDLSASFMN